jgi:hypothetical protein
MSEQYPGGFITKTNPTVDGSTAKGLWTLSQAAGYAKQGLWPTVPAAPTIGTATAGNASASVAFTAPANIGSSAITSYTATSSPGAFTGTGASSPVTVSGLTNGTAYTFTVQATNGAGTGPASAASNSVTPVVPNYIEEVFSTYLYTGTGAARTITNGINLSANGGMVWGKVRSTAQGHIISDTVTGTQKGLTTNSTAAQYSDPQAITSFNSNGFTVGTTGEYNLNGATLASWTFRKQPKFFDIVTYTGNGVAGRTVAHNLGSVPGVMIVKCTDTAGEPWYVYHRSLGATKHILLNSTDAAQTNIEPWNNTEPTSTVFTLAQYNSSNGNGKSYVAYLFAHDAGGFGTTGADNVISCGSYVGNGVAGRTVTLGWEPQFIMIKASTDVYGWHMIDTMRGTSSSSTNLLSQNMVSANTNGAEFAQNYGALPTATGFYLNDSNNNGNGTGNTYIYIAIRRGPMAVPTLGTTVFGISARTGTNANATVTGGSGVDDAVFVKNRGAAVADLLSSRLTGTEYLVTSTTAAGVAAGVTILQANPWDVMDGVKVGTTSTITNASANTFVNYLFSRAPGFMDVVCWTGDGTQNRAIAHNLNAAPELIITKTRNNSGFSWFTYTAPTGLGGSVFINNTSELNTGAGANAWGSTAFNSSNFYISGPTAGYGGINGSGTTYVGYLFATLAGVSKVGSYTGTAALQTVACGFAAGARFVMIKRTDVVGDWYYWDSVRGLSSGNDPYLLMNSAAAEVTGTNYVDTDTTGFKVTAAAPAALNAVGGTYIFLAIA